MSKNRATLSIKLNKIDWTPRKLTNAKKMTHKPMSFKRKDKMSMRFEVKQSRASNFHVTFIHGEKHNHKVYGFKNHMKFKQLGAKCMWNS